MTDPIVTGATNTVAGSTKTGTTDRVKGPWVISDAGLKFFTIWESGIENGTNFQKQQVTNGYILTVYKDSKGLPTVGCGHLVVTADNLKVDDKIDNDKAKAFLIADLATAEKAVNDKVEVPLRQSEYDALVSIAFNTGRGGFLKLAEQVNEGDYKKIPDAIKKYRTRGGNEGRRASEASLFETGVYNATH
jgi:lysozyme